MSPAQTGMNWKKISAIGGAILVVWQIFLLGSNVIESNIKTQRDNAAERQRWRDKYAADSIKTDSRLKVIENRVSDPWYDSVNIDLHELNKKNHITDNF